MRKFFIAGATALMLTATPQIAIGQAAPTMTMEQRGAYEGWPADRRTTFDAWPPEYQAYYWTLTPTQQEGWWVLTDEQRAMVIGLDPQQRLRAWQAIEAQLAGAPPPTAAAPAQAVPPMPTSVPQGGRTPPPHPQGADVRYRSDAVIQAINPEPPPPGEYPVCRGDRQDNCINPREARNR